jgi:hypothetical protein
MRSPGPIRQVTSSSSFLWPSRSDAPSRSKTDLPSRADANRARSAGLRATGVGDQGVGRVDPELRFGGTGRRPAAKPGQLLAEQVLTPLLGHGGDPLAFGAGQHVGGVPSLVLHDLARVDLPGAGADGVQEPPVVGHGDEGAAAGGQMAGQPVDRLDVEMVGRLVEDQQVDLRDQQRGERGPATFTTRQRSHRPIEHIRTQQRRDDLAKHPVAGPVVFGTITEHDGVHCRRRIEGVALVEQPDPQAACVRDPAGVRLLDAREHPDQGALSDPIAADDADPVAIGDTQRDVVEDRSGAVGQ